MMPGREVSMLFRVCLSFDFLYFVEKTESSCKSCTFDFLSFCSVPN